MYKIDFNFNKNVLAKKKKSLFAFIDMMSTKTLHWWSIFYCGDVYTDALHYKIYMNK